MADEPTQVLNAAIATNIEALSITPKAGDDLLTLAKKHVRAQKHNESAVSLLQQAEITTSNTEMYVLPGTYPHVLASEGVNGLTAIRATLMAMYSGQHKHIMGDVVRLLGVLSRITPLLKDTTTPYVAWSVLGPIVDVLQGKIDYMASRASEPKTAPSTPKAHTPDTPPKRPRDEDQPQGRGRGGGGSRGGGGNKRRW